MNYIFNKITDLITNINFFSRTFITLLFISFFLFISHFLYIGFYEEAFHRDICFKTECITNLTEIFKALFLTASTISKFFVFVITIFGLFFAIYTYVLSAKSNLLSTHLAHFSSFQEYISREIDRLPRIEEGSIDIFLFFNFIFRDSIKGKIDISKDYKKFNKKLNIFILEKNSMFFGKMETIKPFKNHQDDVIKIMSIIGFDVSRKPNQTDFFKMESEFYTLIRKVNECFCPELEKIPEKKYH